MPCACCTKPLRVTPCVSNCARLQLNHIAPAAALYELEVWFNQQPTRLEFDADAGQMPYFDLDGLNEAYLFHAILYVDGVAQVLVDANEIEFDCLKFETVVGGQSSATTPFFTLKP